MRLPTWLHNLLHRGEVPRMTVNPYSGYDGSVAPKWFMWQLYREIISSTNDERSYLNGAARYIQTEGQLVEDFVKLEDSVKGTDTSDDIMERMWKADGSSLYLYRDNLISLKVGDDDTVDMLFYYPVSKSCAVEDFKQWIVTKKGESRVSILVTRNGGLVANKVSFKPPVIADLELNYGSGFSKVHEKIVGKLEERKSGMLLLHGNAGSGKSTYIKHLTSVVEREFIFVPVGMSSQLSSPEFISLLMGKKEAVLILEDAEKAVQERGGNGDDSAVATLLNISDGILGSLLSISIIVTYNADRQFIDKALLRKGRLSFDYDFGPLKKADAARLMKHLGKDAPVDGPMTLADIYGVEDDTGHTPAVPKQVGFGALLSSQVAKQAD